MKIVVTGSLGNISKPLAQELIAKGHEVTVISSKADRRKDIEALGASAAIGSVEDVPFLKNSFADADAVYGMTPPNFGATDMIGYYLNVATAYAEAVKNAGVKHLVYLSSYGADLEKGTGIIVGSHQAECLLNDLERVAVTCLRPGYFYYNLYHFMGMIKGQGIIASNFGGDDRLVMVSPLDIAAVAAEELTDPNPKSKIRYIASDEYTCNEVARLLGEAIGKPDLQWLEEKILIGIMQRIDEECRSNVDDFCHSIIIAQIELLLTYTDRYYHRQFITRKMANYQVLDKLEAILADYFNSGQLLKQGLPTVAYISEKLNFSPNYLSRLLKTLTGQSTQQHIHDKLIEKAKEKLSCTELSVSEIAYELGFEHPQSFSKLFKIKTNTSPLEFRQSFN